MEKISRKLADLTVIGAQACIIGFLAAAFVVIVAAGVAAARAILG
jgi:hypothetical protein